VIILFLGLSANAQSKLKIKSIEAATTFSSATAGNGFGGNIFGLKYKVTACSCVGVVVDLALGYRREKNMGVIGPSPIRSQM
ncbi:hypothetical protein CLI75_12480, partial [Porphyromonas gingivalis]